MAVLVKEQGFNKWVGVAVLLVCATVVATADSAALLYGNPQPVQLECNSRDVVWHHNGSMLQAGDVSGQTRYQGVRRHSLDISYATHKAAGSYQCRDSNSRRVLKTYSGVTVQSMLVPDNCTSGNSLPCTDVNEVMVVDLPPEQRQRYRISLSYHHNPAGHYPQETPDYPIQWIVEAPGYDDIYRGCSRALRTPCVIAKCDKGRCNASGYIAGGAGLSVSGRFGQVVEVDLNRLAPGSSISIVELQYHVNLPYRRNAQGSRNMVMLKKYRFNFRDFLPSVKVWSLNCSSNHCDVSVRAGSNVTICSEMGLNHGNGPIPVDSSKWMSRGVGGGMVMMSQCQEETKCCSEEGCSNRSLVSGEWGKCLKLTNVSMGDNGLQLFYQLRSPQDSGVATVNYTLHVIPPSEEPPDLVLIISASAAGGVLVLALSVFICCCCCCCCCYCRRWRRKRHEGERMYPDLGRVQPPPLPRRRYPVQPVEETAPQLDPNYTYVQPNPAPEMANNSGIPMSHNLLQMNRRNERSQSVREELTLHNGSRAQRTLSLQAQRRPSPPQLPPRPDSGGGALFHSSRGSYILPYPPIASLPSDETISLQLPSHSAEDVSSHELEATSHQAHIFQRSTNVPHSSAVYPSPAGLTGTASPPWSPAGDRITQSMVYFAPVPLATSDRRRSYPGTPSD